MGMAGCDQPLTKFFCSGTSSPFLKHDPVHDHEVLCTAYQCAVTVPQGALPQLFLLHRSVPSATMHISIDCTSTFMHLCLLFVQAYPKNSEIIQKARRKNFPDSTSAVLPVKLPVMEDPVLLPVKLPVMEDPVLLQNKPMARSFLESDAWHCSNCCHAEEQLNKSFMSLTTIS